MSYFFDPLNTKDVYIRPSEILLSNYGRKTSCAKLNRQLDTKPKIAIQVTEMYPLFRILSTTTTASEN